MPVLNRNPRGAGVFDFHKLAPGGILAVSPDFSDNITVAGA